MAIDLASVTIEKVRYHDLKALERLFTKAFGDEVNIALFRQRIRRARQFYHLLLPLTSLFAWAKNLFNIYVFKYQGNVAGFIQLSYLNRHQMHLDFIAVSKQFRGQGLGTAVLRKLLELTTDPRGIDVILEVRIDNQAYRLYKRLGFSRETRVLHYEKRFSPPEPVVKVGDLPGWRLLRDEDRSWLCKLYRACVSRRIQKVLRRERGEFMPSLFTRHLDWLKNYLMTSRKIDYVLERGGSIKAWAEIRSYPRAYTHTVSLQLHPRYENMRESIMRQIERQLSRRYSRGTIITTIYDDSIDKQETLEKLGYVQQEAYYLMYRPAPQAGEYAEGPARLKHFRGVLGSRRPTQKTVRYQR